MTGCPICRSLVATDSRYAATQRAYEAGLEDAAAELERLRDALRRVDFEALRRGYNEIRDVALPALMHSVPLATKDSP